MTADFMTERALETSGRSDLGPQYEGFRAKYSTWKHMGIA